MRVGWVLLEAVWKFGHGPVLAMGECKGISSKGFVVETRLSTIGKARKKGSSSLPAEGELEVSLVDSCGLAPGAGPGLKVVVLEDAELDKVQR